MALNVGVELPSADRAVLEAWTRASSMPAGLAQRARIVLLAADGFGTGEIVERVGVSKPTVIQWKRRYGRAVFTPSMTGPVRVARRPSMRSRSCWRRWRRRLSVSA